MLRVAHTLKGAARVVKQSQIAELAHGIEDLLAPFRQGGGVPRDRVDAVLGIVDEISMLLSVLDAPAEVGATPQAAAATTPRDAVPRAVHAELAEMDALLDGVAEAHARVGAVRSASRTVERMRELAERVVMELSGARHVQSGGAKARLLAAELRELVTGWQRELSDGVDQIDVELRQVKDSAERLRLVPVGSLFTTLERAVRDAATTLGKRVVFEATGRDVRFDAHALGVVQDALVQAVRNAVAHGVESESERRAAGKPPEGRVAVAVTRAGKNAVFTCRDDGRGIDLDHVRRVAADAGVAQAAQLSRDDVIGLLLKGGLSTSPKVTTVSGRGIGLDVVREAASQLGGSLALDSEPGRGTTLTLVVPVSVAAVDALMVHAAGRVVAIPLDAVRRTLRVHAEDVVRTPDGDSIVFDGKSVPLSPLWRALRGRADAARSTRSAVLVEGGGALAALEVERLLGTENVVLRALPALAPADPLVAGAVLDVEGNPQLVLDAENLVAAARRTGVASAPAPTTPEPILVVDDSLTTRMLEQSILESAGYDVDLAVSGEEGLSMARKRPYAMFLVDVEMPGMDGFEFVEAIRADPALGRIPAILVTSRSGVEDRARGEEVGADDFVVKGEFDQGALLRRIGELVR